MKLSRLSAVPNKVNLLIFKTLLSRIQIQSRTRKQNILEKKDLPKIKLKADGIRYKAIQKNQYNFGFSDVSIEEIVQAQFVIIKEVHTEPYAKEWAIEKIKGGYFQNPTTVLLEGLTQKGYKDIQRELSELEQCGLWGIDGNDFHIQKTYELMDVAQESGMDIRGSETVIGILIGHTDSLHYRRLYGDFDIQSKVDACLKEKPDQKIILVTGANHADESVKNILVDYPDLSHCIINPSVNSTFKENPYSITMEKKAGITEFFPLAFDSLRQEVFAYYQEKGVLKFFYETMKLASPLWEKIHREEFICIEQVHDYLREHPEDQKSREDYENLAKKMTIPPSLIRRFGI